MSFYICPKVLNILNFVTRSHVDSLRSCAADFESHLILVALWKRKCMTFCCCCCCGSDGTNAAVKRTRCTAIAERQCCRVR